MRLASQHRALALGILAAGALIFTGSATTLHRSQTLTPLRRQLPDSSVTLLDLGRSTELLFVGCEFVRTGFPVSYATRLARLWRRHPTWTFEPLLVDDLDWKRVVEKECKPAWNLVARGPRFEPYYASPRRTYDSGAWYQASRAAIRHFMDPRNFLNDTEIFMFETLAYNASAHTVATVESALAGSFMQGSCPDGGTESYAELLCRLGQRYDISPVFLAGRLVQEQGPGTVQTAGRIGTSLMELYTNEVGKVGENVIWGEKYHRDDEHTQEIVAKGAAAYDGYYNFFNVRAMGSGLFEIRYNAYLEAVDPRTVEKYDGPWDTQVKSISGGVKLLRENYIDTLRHTRYFQKFSVCPSSPRRWQQYMQNLTAPVSEARSARRAYADNGVLDSAWHFVIPVYRALPDEPVGLTNEAQPK